MKKKLFGTMVVAIAMFASYSAYDVQNESELTITVLANVEALANDEGEGSSNTWPCWSEQRKGSGYWRCGNPCKWVDNYGAKGTKSDCYKLNN